MKIKSCTAKSARAKIDYIEQKTKAEKEIIVIEKNDIIETNNAMTAVEQKEYRKAQKDLSCYTKRLDEAIKLNKEKSIITNQKNIEKAQKILQKYENRTDKREKHFVEFTVALTNSQNSFYEKDWQKQTLEYFKQQYPELRVISAVEHRGQHSPHMHILFQSIDKPIRQILSPKSQAREAFQEAYSAVQHNYHSFANSQIAHNELKTLNKGRKYVSLGQYKAKGNFEAKLNEYKSKSEEQETLSQLRKEYRDLNILKREINEKLSYRYEDEIRIDIVDKEATFFYNEYSFVTIKELERAKESAIRKINKYDEEFGIDAEEEKKYVDDSFNDLLELKRTKERLSKGADKEEVIIVDRDKMKEWINNINDSFRLLRAKLEKLRDKVVEKIQKVEAKIDKHPEQIKETNERERKLAEQKKLQKQKQKQQEKEKNVDRGWSR